MRGCCEEDVDVEAVEGLRLGGWMRAKMSGKKDCHCVSYVARKKRAKVCENLLRISITQFSTFKAAKARLLTSSVGLC